MKDKISSLVYGYLYDDKATKKLTSELISLIETNATFKISGTGLVGVLKKGSPKYLETEKFFLKMAESYKKQYNECAWWRFMKRRKLNKKYYIALGLEAREC